MSNPYVGEIRLFAGNFAPAGWELCTGQLLPIAQFDTLFVLIGTTYGGDGQNTFALPDLRGRVPLHQGTGSGASRVIGEAGGTERVTLSVAQLPPHSHAVRASSAAATGGTPGGAVLAATSIASYGSGTPNIPMSAAAFPAEAGSQPHENMAPYLALNYIIALYGIFPSQA